MTVVKMRERNAFVDAVHTTALDMTTTANGALANATTHSANLDLFAQMGNYETLSLDDFSNYFIKAWNENKLAALRLLFFNRDVRGGQKVKKYFQYVLRVYTQHNVEFRMWLGQNLHLIPEFGYWKDLYHLHGTVLWPSVVGYWATQIKEDYELLTNQSYRALYPDRSITLAAKFAPTMRMGNNSKRSQLYANDFVRQFENAYHYRKTISALRSHLNIVEKQMSQQRWEDINYSHVPSVAFMNYRKAFARHDAERFAAFLSDKTAKVNAGTLTPIDVVRKYKQTWGIQDDLEKIWLNLNNVFGASNTRILPVADCSGSMEWGGNKVQPIEVCHALTIYCAERNVGAFQNMYMTFSRTAKFYKFTGDSLYANIEQIQSHSEVANTNVQAVFDEILRVAIANKVPQAEMPEAILLISDMQFDQITSNSNERNIDAARRKFSDAGYEVPQVVFWNVASYENFAATSEEKGVVLISGYSEQILKYVVGVEPLKTPLEVMLDVINSERYSAINI